MNNICVKSNRTALLSWYFLIAWSLCFSFANIANAIVEAVPKLPDNVTPPQAITLSCINSAKTLPALDFCRATFETAREDAEEYNKRIARFCKSIVTFDAELRKKAVNHKLSWDDYKDLNATIVSELQECDANNGDYYAPYRERIRVYKQAIDLVKTRRDAIINFLVIQ